ncbi:helix-turn-helix transcriptional regulator [Alteribacillus sp. JSM 102045]|uniref:helix-turn-helix transcriptional regulator n=1 Tax=Alteribacillus sp. JSM 102045 TaxID=1562101 RepID=UPI0035C12F37
MRDWLLEIRKSKDLTQEQLANKAGIARTTYSMIETGERGVTVENAKRIAKVLNLKWTIFFEENVHVPCNMSRYLEAQKTHQLRRR